MGEIKGKELGFYDYFYYIENLRVVWIIGDINIKR